MRRRNFNRSIMLEIANLQFLISRYAEKHRLFSQRANRKNITPLQLEVFKCDAHTYKMLHWRKLKELKKIITFTSDIKQQRHERH